MKFAYYNVRYRIDCFLYGKHSAKSNLWLGKIATLGLRKGFRKADKQTKRGR